LRTPEGGGYINGAMSLDFCRIQLVERGSYGKGKSAKTRGMQKNHGAKVNKDAQQILNCTVQCVYNSLKLFVAPLLNLFRWFRFLV